MCMTMFPSLLSACIFFLFSDSARALFTFSDHLDSFFNSFQDIDSPWLDNSGLFDLGGFDDALCDADDQSPNMDIDQEETTDANRFSYTSPPTHESGTPPVSRSAACKSAQCSAEVIRSGDSNDQSTTELSHMSSSSSSIPIGDDIIFDPTYDDDYDDLFEVCGKFLKLRC